jgi:hypothetical protein
VISPLSTTTSLILSGQFSHKIFKDQGLTIHFNA